MNIVQNSDSEQCTESKQGWVHQVHTPAQPARIGREPYAQAGRVAPCRGRVAGPLGRIVAMSQHAAVVSPRVSRHSPTAKPLPSCHDTIICIVTRFANQTSCLSRYKDCIVTQPPATKPLSPITIQRLYCDTLTPS